MNRATENIIDIYNLSRRFDTKAALQDVSIQVPRGKVFGLVGENGAGKTTLIKHILGMYRAQQGSVSVFGVDPVKHPKAVLSRIGYLSEQPDLPEWMSISQFMNYMAAFYPTWDHGYASELLRMMDIDPTKKIGELSKGGRARVGLCAAQAYRPDLLLLDEPSSGLDPVARNEILLAIVRTVVSDGRSVLLSSHLLGEVERVSDHLVFFANGKVLLSEPMEAVLERHYEITIRHDGILDRRSFPEIFKVADDQGETRLFCYADLESLLQRLTTAGAQVLDRRRLSLNEAFIARSTTRQVSAELT